MDPSPDAAFQVNPDPDLNPGGPKTYGSYRSGSATLLTTITFALVSTSRKKSHALWGKKENIEQDSCRSRPCWRLSGKQKRVGSASGFRHPFVGNALSLTQSEIDT